MPVLNNVVVKMKIRPGEPEINFDGTYEEVEVIEKDIIGEFVPNRYYNMNSPEQQLVNATLIINYNEYIDKKNTTILYNDIEYAILDIKESMVVSVNDKVLTLKEIL